MKRRYYVLLALASLLVAIGIGTACTNQGEGEVCNIANDSDDCQTENGLACYDHRQLNNTDSDRCCPLDRAKATHPTCVTPIAIVATDATAPADTGPGTVTQDAQVTDSASNPVDAADAADQ